MVSEDGVILVVLLDSGTVLVSVVLPLQSLYIVLLYQNTNTFLK